MPGLLGRRGQACRGPRRQQGQPLGRHSFSAPHALAAPPGWSADWPVGELQGDAGCQEVDLPCWGFCAQRCGPWRSGRRVQTLCSGEQQAPGAGGCGVCMRAESRLAAVRLAGGRAVRPVPRLLCVQLQAELLTCEVCCSHLSDWILGGRLETPHTQLRTHPTRAAPPLGARLSLAARERAASGARSTCSWRTHTTELLLVRGVARAHAHSAANDELHKPHASSRPRGGAPSCKPRKRCAGLPSCAAAPHGACSR